MSPTAFVVLAAGRGSRMGRVGDALHKALVPLGREAVLTKLLRLRPPGSRIIIATGHRWSQVARYVRMAHPSLCDQLSFTFVEGWDQPGAGPGSSLLHALESVREDEDVVFTTCDTLWAEDPMLWHTPELSWVGVAPVPAGTARERWCRIMADGRGRVMEIVDKRPGRADLAWVGLAQIAREDVPMFRTWLATGTPIAGELQVSAGLAGIPHLFTRRIEWTDVGDEEAYREAVRREVGYDATKPGQATYVLEDEGRVVKFFADADTVQARVHRADQSPFFPHVVDDQDDMFAYGFLPGCSGYTLMEQSAANLTGIIGACKARLWMPVKWTGRNVVEHAQRFYRTKTFERVDQLRPELRSRAVAAASRIDWGRLCVGVQPSVWHGDLNLGNIVTDGSRPHRVYGIDWREDFAGEVEWGDRRYDVAKLLTSLVHIHWDRAQRGDFRPWPRGRELACYMRDLITPDIEMIAALTLLNSAPLHEAPLDEVLVARGCARLEALS